MVGEEGLQDSGASSQIHSAKRGFACLIALPVIKSCSCHGCSGRTSSREVKLIGLITGLTGKTAVGPEVGPTTTFCPPMTAGEGELVAQPPGEARFVVDCRAYPVALVGHVKITLAPECVIVSRCPAPARPGDFGQRCRR